MKNLNELFESICNTIEKCAVSIDGEIISYVNPKMLDKQNKWDKLEEIKFLHIRRAHIYDKMKDTDDSAILHDLFSTVMKIEEELQELWGFEKNPNFIKFWQVPQCTCAVMDNEDRYPTGPYTHDSTCKVHS